MISKKNTYLNYHSLLIILLYYIMPTENEKKSTAKAATTTPAKKKLSHPIKDIKTIMTNWTENWVISDYQAFNLAAMITTKVQTSQDPSKVMSCIYGAEIIKSLAAKYSLVKLDAINELFIKNITALGNVAATK